MSDAVQITPAAVEPAPFIKWVGGKTRLLEQLEGFFPVDFARYHEPFVGGGAVFFRVQPRRAMLSDVNPRLVNAWRAVRDQPWDVIDRLEHHRQRHEAPYYYAARTRFNRGEGLQPLDQAALFIYLNKTCFNGLYRENRRGEFNVPVGRYTNPGVYDIANILAVSERLQGVDLRVGSFETVLERAEPGDFIYFDPPYVPVSATSSFTGYVGAGFDHRLQERLRDVFGALVDRGCSVVLSNSDCEYVRELYGAWRVETVEAPRSINSRGDRRGAVNEVVVMGGPGCA
jgi:DNA adenine methylase